MAQTIPLRPNQPETQAPQQQMPEQITISKFDNGWLVFKGNPNPNGKHVTKVAETKEKTMDIIKDLL